MYGFSILMFIFGTLVLLAGLFMYIEHKIKKEIPNYKV